MNSALRWREAKGNPATEGGSGRPPNCGGEKGRIMAIYKRGGVYWFAFWFRGKRYQRSTKTGNNRLAENIESTFKTALIKGEVGIVERKPSQALKDFAQRFIDTIQVRCAAKPKTVEFYAQQLARLLEFEPLAKARLTEIDEALIESFVQHRCRQMSRAGANRKKKREPLVERPVSAASVNRALATLRRLLRLAQEWREIDRVPRVRLLPGECNREFVLNHGQERAYLAASAQPLRDVATLILDTGLRVGEALALDWENIHLQPASGARFGYLHVRDGKSKFARRNVPLTGRARAMLETRKAASKSGWVFSSDSGCPMLNSSLDHFHRELRQTLKAGPEFVLHSLRHTYGTRLGEGGADAFSIMRLMGHSSVTISQRYVHPTPEALERAVERLEALNQTAIAALPAPATITATVAQTAPVSD